MKYLSGKPFSSKPPTKDYRDNWARTFGISDADIRRYRKRLRRSLKALPAMSRSLVKALAPVGKASKSPGNAKRGGR